MGRVLGHPGWKSGNATDPTQAGLEVQADGAVPQIDAKDGEHYVELELRCPESGRQKPGSTNASIYQDVDTVEGNNYVLSFSYSPRVGDPATDGIEVWFDGEVATIDSGKVGEWTEYTFAVEAGEDPTDSTPDSSRLEFKAVGTSDSLGGFIDDVSLTACALVDEDVCRTASRAARAMTARSGHASPARSASTSAPTAASRSSLRRPASRRCSPMACR